jgi:hypothetical protein
MKERNEIMKRWFGWGKRLTLKHPVTNPRMVEFLKYLFLRGNKKEKSKCSPFMMITLAAKFGTSNKSFDSEDYCKAALLESGGEPIFKAEDIPEEWRVKQLISQFVNEMKKKINLSETMSPEDIRKRLLYLLGLTHTEPKHEAIPYNHDVLADNLIAVEK